jgi:hypothetical protein
VNSSHAALIEQGQEGEVSAPRVAVLTALLAACLTVGLFTALPTEAATYYRWNDDQGKLVISDRPPTDPAISYEVVNPGSTLIRRVAPGEGAVPPETTPRPGNEFDPVDTRAESEQLSQKNPESCARARANLQTLDSAARIRMRNEETGELDFLSDEDREIQRKKAQDTIRITCE